MKPLIRKLFSLIALLLSLTQGFGVTSVYGLPQGSIEPDDRVDPTKNTVFCQTVFGSELGATALPIIFHAIALKSWISNFERIQLNDLTAKKKGHAPAILRYRPEAHPDKEPHTLSYHQGIVVPAKTYGIGEDVNPPIADLMMNRMNFQAGPRDIVRLEQGETADAFEMRMHSWIDPLKKFDFSDLAERIEIRIYDTESNHVDIEWSYTSLKGERVVAYTRGSVIPYKQEPVDFNRPMFTVRIPYENLDSAGFMEWIRRTLEDHPVAQAILEHQKSSQQIDYYWEALGKDEYTTMSLADSPTLIGLEKKPEQNHMGQSSEIFLEVSPNKIWVHHLDYVIDMSTMFQNNASKN